MAKNPLCVAILWHMHQPDYGNEETGYTYLPWTRFHAVKDYYDMASLAAREPGLHLTINIVPALIDQLEAYAGGKVDETYASLTLKDAGQLDEREKAFLLWGFFQLPWKQMILPYPRYRDLLERRGSLDLRGSYSSGLKRYSTQDYRDLQVWFNLSWCGNELREYPEVAELLRRGRDFGEEDKKRLLEIQAEFIGRILPLYRTLLREKCLEISVSPYYHPILPLLCSSDRALEATPNLRLPPRSFRFPGDAHEQIIRAQRRFQDVFGTASGGMWPSEGALSEEVSRLAGDLGLRWLASDEGVLQNSLKRAGRIETVLGAVERYRAWRHLEGPAIFFRDHELSDLIGFTYASWTAEAAVSDFMQRLLRIYDVLPDDGRHYVVPVILDGENAWEHYARNGAPFLSLLYRKLREESSLRTVTFSEYLGIEPEQEELPGIVAGSWIYSSLTTWIGHPEKNTAWESLSAARRAFADLAKTCADPQRRERAWREIMIAEGSDWFWWYGDDHQTQNAVEFDTLFRSHLKNVYRLLGGTVPLELDVPIKRADIRTQYRNPVHTISPHLDGRVTDYFEWLSAGFATPAGGGSMHQAVRRLEKAFFGYDTNRFYVRLDFAGGLENLPPQMAVHFQFVSPRTCLLILDEAGQDGSRTCRLLGPCGSDQEPQAGCGRIMEVGVPLRALGIEEPDEVRFFVALLENDKELERFPSTGFLVVPVDPWGLNQQEWMV